MKKFFYIFLIAVTFFLTSCRDGRNDIEKEPMSDISVQTITRQEAKSKLIESSRFLDVRVDDMKEITICRCPLDIDLHPSIWIIPYIVVDKNYKAILYQNILYLGDEPLYFDKLYIRTSSGVSVFRYHGVVKDYAGEEYNGFMGAELYEKLNDGIKTGYAKFRLEGRTFGERELTEEELVDMEELFALYEFFRGVKVDD